MEDGASVFEAGPDNVQEEAQPLVASQKRERKRPERAYAPTPKQLEALAKARKSKQAKRLSIFHKPKKQSQRSQRSPC